MHTRDEVRPASSTGGGAVSGRLLGGFGRTTLLALSALTGCAVLIALGATVSVCWAIHPLLSALATIGLLGCAARFAARLFRGGGVRSR